MQDGRTRRISVSQGGRMQGFLASHCATLVYASGPLAGSEVALEQERVSLGRGSDADVTLDDASISNLHACLELAGGAFRIRDLGSTNGVKVNGSKVSAAELKHGDQIQLGSVSLRYRVEPRKASAPVHHLDED